MEFSFSLNEAKAFSKIGCIEEWVHLFLKTKGCNKALSDGLKLQRRYWLGPIALPISELTRCCGPEPEMEYYNDPNDWEKHIAHFCQLFESGWEPGPLIAEHNKKSP